MASQTHLDLFGIIAHMLNMQYYETMCLGGYRDSSVVYQFSDQFQSSQVLQFQVHLKLILSVILLNLYAASSFDGCMFLRLNLALRRNNIQIKNVKLFYLLNQSSNSIRNLEVPIAFLHLVICRTPVLSTYPYSNKTFQ